MQLIRGIGSIFPFYCTMFNLIVKVTKLVTRTNTQTVNIMLFNKTSHTNAFKYIAYFKVLYFFSFFICITSTINAKAIEK